MEANDDKDYFKTEIESDEMALTFDPKAISLTEFKKVKCTRCNGTGRVPKYKHIDDGKCFACNGTRWVSVAIQPPPPINEVPLFVTLQQVKDLSPDPRFDCFGGSVASFRANFEKLLVALGRRDDMAAVVSIGDVAKAFGTGTARQLALKIPGIDYRTITRMILPTAERAAAAINESSLSHAVAVARRLTDTSEEVEPLHRALIRHFASYHDTAESHAKACAEAIAVIARRGVFVGEPYPYLFECHRVDQHAWQVLKEMARRQSVDPSEAASQEGQRQMEDLYSVSPLHLFRRKVGDGMA
ncbi:hypothetical protein GUK30_32520 [Rhizobium leguminosarum]|uniref:hypothetical protein n=1 Tax=Rhizobium ruizarguesonis TaxID=2081791 RepID=UPI0013BFC497|nr:hypothetical protein [Rhizobium ruizarguesonis]NEI24072.1 hypothetical protein [Rhizobium ruizarguesonis]